jgi:uncharacterized RDD family membrane protein YckC
MFCSKCGRKTDSTGRYCQWCGVDLESQPPRPRIRRMKPFIRTEEYSGLARRFLAFIIDFIFLVVIDLFLAGIFGLSEGARMLYALLRGNPMLDRSGQEVTGALIPFQIVLTVGVLLVLAPWLYYALLESSRDQATLGKIALRIAVTDMHGNRCSFARSTLRHFAKLLSLFTVFVGVLIIPFTKRKQALHDIIAGCLCFIQ